MKKPLTVAIFAALLCSCGGKNLDGLKPNENAPKFFCNGDALTSVNDNSSFDEATRPSDGEEIVSRIASGESLFLLWHQDGCSHCEILRDVFAPFVKNTKALVYSFNREHLLSGIAEIEEAYPSIGEGFPAPATPYLFYLDAKEKTATKIDLTGKTTDLYDFTETMYQFMDFQPTYTFRSFSNFESFCNTKKCLAYVEDQASYGSLAMSTLQDARKGSKKEFAILDYEYLTDGDKTAFQQKYGTPASSLLNYGDEKGPTLISSGQEEIILNYFI